MKVQTRVVSEWEEISGAICRCCSCRRRRPPTETEATYHDGYLSNTLSIGHYLLLYLLHANNLISYADKLAMGDC